MREAGYRRRRRTNRIPVVNLDDVLKSVLNVLLRHGFGMRHRVLDISRESLHIHAHNILDGDYNQPM